MKKLLDLDIKDYQKQDHIIKRIAVRAIIYEKPFLYMIQSKKYQEYKFPGGGQNTGETLIETLKREVLEEAGIILDDDVVAYGYVDEKRKAMIEKDSIFHMTSYYYICKIKTLTDYRHLDAYEKIYGYELKKIHIDDAIKQNQKLILIDNTQFSWVFRELEILKMIKNEF
ncbi:MAG: NUDIX domain-containing protein [Acholeplasmataceae bacterium]